jgi:hypothetical protein
MKFVKKIENPNDRTTYSMIYFDGHQNEYVVKFWRKGKYQPREDYPTDTQLEAQQHAELGIV